MLICFVYQGLTEKVHDVWGVNTNKSHWLWFIVKPILESEEKQAFEFRDAQEKNPQTDHHRDFGKESLFSHLGITVSS